MSDRRTTPLEFGNLDLAAPVDSPPLLFDRLRVPCDCGGTLIGEEYAFFPSSVFIHGKCLKCGPRSAMFAPPVNATEGERQEMVAAELHGFAQELAEQYKKTDDGTTVSDFLAYLNERRSA